MTGNIFLIGLMGSGKTTLGRQLAKHFSLTFYDADQYLIKKTGVSIPTIFELEGEEGFRQRESSVIDELTQEQNIVLATGGGAILREPNQSCLHNRGFVVYLHADPHTLYERTRYDKSRPLLQVDDPLGALERLYEFRDPIYRQVAHAVLHVDFSPSPILLRHLVALLPHTT